MLAPTFASSQPVTGAAASQVAATNSSPFAAADPAPDDARRAEREAPVAQELDPLVVGRVSARRRREGLAPELEARLVASFIPALITAYLSRLMDLPEQPLLPELWHEEYRVLLPDGIARAWPLDSEPSSSEGDGAAEDTATTDSIAAQRRWLAMALDTAVQELEQERAARVRHATILPDRRDLFIAVTRAA